MSYLALDLGRNYTGCCLCSKNKIVKYWTEEFKGDGEYCSAFGAFLEELVTEGGIKIIVYEQVTFVQGRRGFQAWFHLEGILKYISETYSVKLESLNVQSIKKDFTGSGRASKEDMMNKAVELGHCPRTSDEADAIAVAHCSIKAKLFHSILKD